VIETLKRWLSPPPALVLAARDLEDAKRGLLRAQSGREYADGLVRYYESKIKRLNLYLKEAGE
jgi:hypothetical protein